MDVDKKKQTSISSTSSSVLKSVNVNSVPAVAPALVVNVPVAAPAVAEAEQVSSKVNTAVYSERLRRAPLILYAVIDNSGSMGGSCGGREAEDDDFSRLDLVKHTLSTLVAALTEEDQICIIKFSTVARIFAPLTALTDSNKADLQARLLTDLHPEGQTNIWDGLRLAIDQIAALPPQISLEANVQIYLLTDGEPTINPPQPLPQTLETYLRLRLPHPHPQPVVNTFGYGYSLDSKLLYDVARKSHGSFGYIPDSSMVGTVFINALANSLIDEKPELFDLSASVPRQAADLMVKYLRGVANPRTFVSSSDGDVVVNVNTTVSSLGSGSTHSTMTGLPTSNTPVLTPEVIVQELITEIQKVYTATQGRDGISPEVMQFLEGLLLDCAPNAEANLGQISKAVEPKYFAQWGKHYLLSVLSAYENRVCINFKDRGMQSFCTNRFMEEQSHVSEIFMTLAPPAPSNAKVQSRSGRQFTNSSTAYTSPAPVVVSGAGNARNAMFNMSRGASGMSRFLNVDGGCFTAESLVVTSVDGKSVQQQVRDLTKGSKVLSDNGMTTVEAVVQIRYTGALYAVHGMVLTAYHPVLLNGTPAFPCEIGQPVHTDEGFDGYVYDVVLANRGIMASPKVNGGIFHVATWGHTCQLPKFEHDYFGSEQIVHDLQLQSASSYEDGFIVIEAPHFIRDDNTGLIVQLLCC